MARHRGGPDDERDAADARPDAARLADHRDLWAAVNAQFTDEAAAERWAAPGLEWGLFRRPEDELRVLGDVTGLGALQEALSQHGYDRALLEKLCHRNWIGVLERTWGG